MLKSAFTGAFALLMLFHSLLLRADNLYQPGQFRAPVADAKAFKIGDNLTVLIYEDASSTTSAETTSDKSSGVNIGVKSKNVDTPATATVDLGDQAQGKGTIQRSGKLLAQITVTVTSVDPSGLLAVSGEQEITVNDETQKIKLEGKVRPSDINENNTIISTRLANAKISYTGDGILGDRQRPGLITRFLNWLGAI
jgi:flagellar L-ring protein precursor FlgH